MDHFKHENMSQVDLDFAKILCEDTTAYEHAVSVSFEGVDELQGVDLRISAYEIVHFRARLEDDCTCGHCGDLDVVPQWQHHIYHVCEIWMNGDKAVFNQSTDPWIPTIMDTFLIWGLARPQNLEQGKQYAMLISAVMEHCTQRFARGRVILDR